MYVNRRNDPPFHGKCAYCEEIITSNQRGDVEHYRPKGAVSNAENQPVKLRVGGEDIPHPGYYWLAYDWRNLLPSCILCNQLSRGDESLLGKGNRFPVEGDNAWEPGGEAAERPLILNPCFDDPEEHLGLDDTGLLFWKSERGEATVKILGLNERNLPERRRRELENVRYVFAHLLADLTLVRENGLIATAKDRIREAEIGKSEFAMAGRKALSVARTAIQGVS